MKETEPALLDEKDRKILYELDSDARQPCSQIAKKLNLSTEVVNYRIRRLEDNNIITQYQLIVNLSRLNIIQFKVCLAFQHMSSQKLNAAIEALKQNKAVKWIVSCRGSWDLLISLETDSIENVDTLKNEVLSLFEGHIAEKAISILVEAVTYNRDYLVEDNRLLNSTRAIMKKDKPIVIEDIDLQILKSLAANARKSIVTVAEELNSTPRIVNYRIKQMMKQKLILGFKIALNYERVGILFYKTFIHLDTPKEDRIRTLVQYLELHKNIVHHVKVLSNWDLEPEFEVRSEKEFNGILTEMKDKFSDIIKKVDIITISKEHKFVYF